MHDFVLAWNEFDGPELIPFPPPGFVRVPQNEEAFEPHSRA
jgi:hypothetical protein